MSELYIMALCANGIKLGEELGHRLHPLTWMRAPGHRHKFDRLGRDDIALG